ncbi:MAG: hypothetical protein E2P02_03585 [Acidobacteria bacterium]|nr:MAG: hypothetical protein E2P02_03585 [Acidobacteriota bacterium]
MVVTVATEGIVDTAVVARILSALHLELGPVHGERGKTWLDRQLQGYNQAARFAPDSCYAISITMATVLRTSLLRFSRRRLRT